MVAAAAPTPLLRVAVAGTASAGGALSFAMASGQPNLIWVAIGVFMTLVAAIVPMLPPPRPDSPQVGEDGSPITAGLLSGGFSFVLMQAIGFAITAPAAHFASSVDFAPEVVIAVNMGHYATILVIAIPLCVVIGGVFLPRPPGLWKTVPWLLVGVFVPAVVANAIALFAGSNERREILAQEPVSNVVAATVVAVLMLTIAQLLGVAARSLLHIFFPPTRTR